MPKCWGLCLNESQSERDTLHACLIFPSLRPVAFALHFAVLQARAGALFAAGVQSAPAVAERASALPWNCRADFSHTFQVCMAIATAEL